MIGILLIPLIIFWILWLALAGANEGREPDRGAAIGTVWILLAMLFGLAFI